MNCKQPHKTLNIFEFMKRYFELCDGVSITLLNYLIDIHIVSCHLVMFYCEISKKLIEYVKRIAKVT